MNPLAQQLNEIINNKTPSIYKSLSNFGKEIYFPKGILSQSQEAKEKAHKYNATLGIATENNQPIYYPSIQQHLSDVNPKDVYPYAPAAGKPELRKEWNNKIYKDNPKLEGKKISLPIVTCGITHGLSLVGDLFISKDDVILMSDKFWGNYKLIYEIGYQAKIKTYPLFNDQGGFNITEFENAVSQAGKDSKKIIILMNFPNNPTGYTPTPKEAEQIKDIIIKQANKSSEIIFITDDAYYNLFYGDSIRDSLFSYLVGQHENILCIKLDGATKEEYVWGFRVGFITFGLGNQSAAEDVYPALEKKVMGVIRSKLSNAPHLSQTLVLKALQSPQHAAEATSKYEIMRDRALKVQKVLQIPKYDSAWSVYPFNSGYFMCLQLKNVNAEKLRLHLLDKYGVGVISVDDKDLRIAFSCVDSENIEELFDIIFQGVKDLE